MSERMWQCDDCGEIYYVEVLAALCCANISAVYKCEVCGNIGDVENCTHDRKPGDAVA